MFWGGVALRNKGRPVVPASVHPAIDWRLQLGLVEGGGAQHHAQSLMETATEKI